jgi:hypothetical protein
MKRITLAMSAAALLAGTTFASAQVYYDPPGSAWQNPGLLESQGLAPYRYPYRGYGAYGAYGAYGYVPGTYGAYGYAPYRYYRPDDPPGSRFQDRGFREELGYPPW